MEEREEAVERDGATDEATVDVLRVDVVPSREPTGFAPALVLEVVLGRDPIEDPIVEVLPLTVPAL